MIFWRGKGIWAAVVPFLLTIALQLIFGDEAVYAGIGYTVGGILVWVWGRRWNKEVESFRDFGSENSTNQPRKIYKHSLFWIDMEYWSIFFVLLGVSILVSELLVAMSVDALLSICGIGILIMIGIQLANNMPKLGAKRLGVDHSEESKKPPAIFKKDAAANLTKDGSESKSTAVKIKLKPSLSSSNKFIQDLKKNRDKSEEFKTSDPNRFMPK